jgi:PIN domain nuclease of toxin-antitoxin system
MRLLLDTHTFLWWDGQPERLTERALELLADRSNEILLSVASLWEIQIKLEIGKLRLKVPLLEMVSDEETANRFTLLPISAAHVFALDRLPAAHRDPFDRILAAQTLAEAVVLITRDPAFRSFPVQTLW